MQQQQKKKIEKGQKCNGLYIPKQDLLLCRMSCTKLREFLCKINIILLITDIKASNIKSHYP